MIPVPKPPVLHIPTCNKDVAERIGKAPDSLDTHASELALAPIPCGHLASGPQRVSAHQVREFRNRALDNGYNLVGIRTGSKAPAAPGWQHGETRESLLDVRENALHTGVLLGDVRCVDLDVDDAQVALKVMRQARLHLPHGALIRRRTGSPRLSMLYRAATGQPTKRVIKGTKGQVEVLGHGQQAVVHGQHPSGAFISWRDGRGPDTVPLDQLPAVSETRISAFLDACAPLLEPVSVVEASAARHPPEVEWKLPSAFASMPLDNDLGAGIEDTPNWFTQRGRSTRWCRSV
jgi:Bifunctional DNA primase/polymerase, N-terminal